METTVRDGIDTMTPESAMFIYATEMIAEYYSSISLANRSVLTVTGSGDQMLNGYFLGAAEVTCFDINKRAALFADLKIHALRILPYEKFLLFFGSTYNDATFDFSLYQRFRSSLRDDSRIFFDKLYDSTTPEKFLRTGFFRDRSFLTIPIREVNHYLRDEKSYIGMQRMLHHVEPKFIICDIWNLPLHLENNTFDVINLSNILDYFIDDSEQKSDDLMVFLTSLAKNVSRYGKILYYSYSPLGYEQGMVPCASRSTTFERIKTLEIFDVHRTYFQGMKKLGNDHVSWLQKK